MLLIHLLLSSGSVECTSGDFFLPLFRNYVYYHFIFPKINKRGAGIRAGGRGWKIFQKLISGGGLLFGTREYPDTKEEAASNISVRAKVIKHYLYNLLFSFVSVLQILFDQQTGLNMQDVLITHDEGKLQLWTGDEVVTK